MYYVLPSRHISIDSITTATMKKTRVIIKIHFWKRKESRKIGFFEKKVSVSVSVQVLTRNALLRARSPF